jgi:hypothetical protein
VQCCKFRWLIYINLIISVVDYGNHIRMLVLANTLAQVMMFECSRSNLDRDTDYPAEVCRGSYFLRPLSV